MGEVMEKWPNSRVIISSFSSQLHRMQMILEEAQRHGRKVAFAGYSMIQNLEVALRTGAIKVPKDTVVKMEDIIKLPDGKVTIVCTGSQGEFSAVLNRMATGAHKYIKIKNSDVVVFSSNPIPGNEKYVVRTVDGLMREGERSSKTAKHISPELARFTSVVMATMTTMFALSRSSIRRTIFQIMVSSICLSTMPILPKKNAVYREKISLCVTQVTWLSSITRARAKSVAYRSAALCMMMREKSSARWC